MNLFELFVKIGVDDQASDKISDLSSKLGNGLKTAAKIGAAAVGAASTAIVALGKIGLEYNSQMEQYTTNFTTMLGSQEASVKKVEELKKFAASTPLSMDDLAKGTQTLLAFGVESENSTGILRQLGDIALGDADKMQRLSTAFGKATAAGKLSGEVVQQMIDAGWNPLIQISQAAGETMEETQKRMSAGKISVEELQAAMEAVTSGTGQFAGGMEAASHTTQGLISTLQDNVKSKIGEAFQSVSDILQSEVLPRAIEFVNSINVDSIIENVNGLVSAFIELSPVIAAATAATLAYKAAVSISKVIDMVRKATEGQTIAQAALNAVMNANPFVLVTTLIVGLVAAIVTLWNTNENFRVALINIWDGIRKTFSDAWNFIVSVWNQAKPYFEAIWVAIKITFSVVKTVLGDFFSSAWYAIQGVWNVATGYFSNVWNTIKGIFSAVESVLRGDFEGAWNAIKNVFSGWGEFFQGLFDEIGKVFGEIWSVFEDIGSNAVEALKQGISNAWNGLTSWFNDLWNSLFGNRTADITVNTTENRTVRTVNGSHANGLDYVPFDGYIAELHKGETVLTANEAENYRSGRGGVTIIQNIYSQAKTAADLMLEARHEQERAVLLGV